MVLSNNMHNKAKPEFRQLPIDKLVRGKYQPRQLFDNESLHELAQSIASAGVISPIVVRPTCDDHYEIIAGERRWRAAQLARLDYVPCLINYYSDEQALAVATIENVNRVDLNPIEEAEAYQRLIDEFDYLHEEIAAVVGKSRAKITNNLRLLKLADAAKQLIIDNKLSEGHGKVLAGLPNKWQIELAQKCLIYGWSVRKIEQEAKKILAHNTPTKTGKDPDIALLETQLADYMGCHVSIEFLEQKGSMKIDFHNLEVLEGIFEKLGFKKESV